MEFVLFVLFDDLSSTVSLKNTILPVVCVCVCVCVCAHAHACVHICVCERERERDLVSHIYVRMLITGGVGIAWYSNSLWAGWLRYDS
jgi:hypothetical protein